MIRRIIENNSAQDFDFSSITSAKFCSKKAPKISLAQYMKRILKYTRFEESTLIIALIYIDRVCEEYSIKLNDYCTHRLILTSILIAWKFNEDLICSNEYCSNVFGIDLKELNLMESEFCRLLAYRFYVPEEQFCLYKRNLDCASNICC